MKPLTINDLKEKNLIIYEYIAGSTLYGLNTPTSDIDIRGVYITPMNRFYSVDKNAYQEQVSDDKNDTVYYELSKYLELLKNSNPNILESLNVPEDKILIKNELFNYVLLNKDRFISKESIKPLIGYAKSQIGKATGLNKKIVKQVLHKKGVLDFCYIPLNDGSTHISKMLNDMGLKQEYCGLSAIPNMRDMYNVFYDFKQHYENEFLTEEERIYSSYNEKQVRFCSAIKSYATLYGLSFANYHNLMLFETMLPSKGWANLGFKGIIGEDSMQVRLSSIPKDAMKICVMSYNEQGYSIHCKEYKEYKEWEENRNPERFKLNCKNARNYDCKNMMHCIRLLKMGKETLETGKLNVVRSEDKEYLLDVKNGKYTYEEIMSYCDELLDNIKDIEESSTLPDCNNKESINRLSVIMRKEFYHADMINKINDCITLISKEMIEEDYSTAYGQLNRDLDYLTVKLPELINKKLQK